MRPLDNPPFEVGSFKQVFTQESRWLLKGHRGKAHKRARERRREDMADCILCRREVIDNIDPQKIITCARCVQGLLSATRENKITYRDRLISEGKLEEARSVESFIAPEEEISE